MDFIKVSPLSVVKLINSLCEKKIKILWSNTFSCFTAHCTTSFAGVRRPAHANMNTQREDGCEIKCRQYCRVQHLDHSQTSGCHYWFDEF